MATSDAPPQISGIEIAPASVPAASAPPPANAPSVHEPVVRPWELELLLSLSLVFALMQLPAQVDAVFHGLEPQLDRGMRMAAFMVYQLVKLPLYLLTGAFVLHLAARAYWVGLIGLEAVFPKGVRWDELPYGPITREVQQQRVTQLQPMIDRADRVGSIIFSTSLALVMTFAFGTVFTAVAGAVAFGASSFLFGGRYLGGLYFLAIGVFLAPSVAVKWVDQRYGASLPEGSAGRRWLRRAAVLSFYNSGGAAVLSVWLILLTNLPRRRVGVVLGAVLTSLFAFFIVKDILLPRGTVTADGYAYLPDDGPRSIRSAAYENLRAANGSYEEVVSVHSDVATGPYLRLFLPYIPFRMNAVMRERCPGLPELGGNGMRMAARDPVPASADAQDRVLRCWASLQPVKLNGAEIRPGFRFYTHPQTGVRGVVAYLPTEGLPRGENVLEVAGLPRVGEDARTRPPRPASVIPFWR